ncbi:hypothetical protein NC652_035552 [Populus alba x Populus x berolinensis]|nr:hypothetical protein NC652_035546 [Populus alba x Populus x berolinensis]KAJ6876220.1 hypothetical protein NC652_035552 [Populus alba x Populus x berolinensis]
MRKSGRMRERPKLSMSFGPNAQASIKMCQPFSFAMFIHEYGYLAPILKLILGHHEVAVSLNSPSCRTH